MMARPKYPSEEKDKFMVRFPNGLRDKIAEVALQHGRSSNSEIIMRLEASFQPSMSLESDIAKVLEDFINAKVAERLREIANRISS
jgi:hypothetical protein